jgi:hypothetical protein
MSDVPFRESTLQCTPTSFSLMAGSQRLWRVLCHTRKHTSRDFWHCTASNWHPLMSRLGARQLMQYGMIIYDTPPDHHRM